MNPLKKLAGQTAIYGMSSMIGRLLNYLLVPIYTRVFIPSEFGVVAELYAYIAFLNVVLTYGMETSFFRHYNESDNKKKVFSTSFGSIMMSSMLFIIAIFLFKDGIASVIRYAANPEYILFVAFIVYLDALTVIPFARLRAENKAKKFAFLKLLNIGVNIGFNLFFIVLCPYLVNNNISENFLGPFIQMVYNPDIGVGYVFISNLIASAVTFLILFPSAFKMQSGIDIKLWKRMIMYALPLLIAGFTGIINETIDRVLIKFLLPADISMTQLGIYSACYKISIIITIFIQAFRFAAEPFFFSQAKSHNAKEVYAHVMKFFTIACLLLFLLIVMYLDVVKHFVGRDYHEGLKVVPILLIANLFLGVYYNLSVWYKLLNKTIFGAYFSITGALITITLNFMWIPVWGYVGSAWATLICYFSMMTLSYFIGRRYYKISYDVKRVVLYFVAALGLYGLSLFLNTHFTAYYIINTLCVLAFIVLVLKLELNERSLTTLKSLRQKENTEN